MKIENGGEIQKPDGEKVQVHQYAIRLNGGIGPTVYVSEEDIIEGPIGTYEPVDLELPLHPVDNPLNSCPDDCPFE